jgi:soluble lytic murein transglycosylase
VGRRRAASERRREEEVAVRCAAAVLLATVLPVVLAAQSPACGGSPALNADSLVALGRFWHAERAAPPLPRPPRAVPLSVALLHARIHAGLGRWSEVNEVLRRARGADTVPEALALEAEAAERLEDWAAAEAGYRRLSAMSSASATLRTPALVRRAAALEMLGRPDSAGIAWRRAAQALPEIADWLAIHRAELERDTTLAFASVGLPRSPGAAQRASLLIAQRRVEVGNLTGALEVYKRMGRPLDLARVEFALGERRTARLRVDSVLLLDATRPQALLAANLLAAQGEPLTADELVGTARVYRALNDLRSAERALRLALEKADTSVALWLELSALLSDRRDGFGARAAAESAERHARRPGVDPGVLAQVAVARVSALVASRHWDAADTLLGRLVARFPGDTATARAVLLLAEHDRATAQGAAEAERYRQLVEHFAATPSANLARFRIGLALYAGGRRDSAAAVLADVLARDGANLLGTAPRFWDARVRLERGDSAGRAVLRRIAALEPMSYYGVRARNLTNDSLGFVADTVLPVPPPEALPPARARERIRLLSLVGLEQEARDEARGWMGDPSTPAQLLVAAAAGAAAAGLARESILLAEAARSRAGLSEGVARGLLPLPYRGVIEGEAAEQCLDPLLLAAIIRQESRFTARIVSRAGARGMAQVLPSTGRQLARQLGIRVWDPELLFVPDFNLHLGAHFLRERLRADGMPVYAAIAAYDAGTQRVDRWRSWPEFRDPDLFVERVAIAETRNYVKTVFASYQWYRRTYAAPGGPASSDPRPY